MATLTATQAANAAAQFLGVQDSGESLSPAQLADALAAVNALLDNWSIEQLMVPSLTLSIFPLVALTQSYTIGAGGVFNVTRPSDIVAAEVSIPGPGGTNIQFPVEVVDAKKWSSLPDRTSASNVIKALFYDRGNPLGKVYVAPLPLAAVNLELTMVVPFTAFADLTTPVTMFPGYSRAIELGLAVELAPQYDMQPSPALAQIYADALARVRNLNAGLLGMTPPQGQVDAMTQPPAPIMRQGA